MGQRFYNFPRVRICAHVRKVFLENLCPQCSSVPIFVTFYTQNACNLQTFLYLCSEMSHKYVFIMARPIRETPVLKGEDAFRSTFGRLQGKNFEMRRLEVEHMSKEQRA